MIRYVKLKNYKSLVDLNVDFMKTSTKAKDLILIYGENGIGKSNFASAFYTLNETMRTMNSIEEFKKFIEDFNDEQKSFVENKIKKYYKDTEMIIKNCKTINSDSNMIMEFGFNYKGKDGVYKIEMNDTIIVHEILHYVLNKNITTFFDISNDKVYINENIFKDKNYYKDFVELINKYWSKHSFFSILSFEIDDKKDGYVNERIDNSLEDAFYYLKTICTKIKGGNHSEFGMIGTNHIDIDNYSKGKIIASDEEKLDKVEFFLNKFFTSISSDIKRVYYSKERKDNIIKYKLILKKKIYNKIIDIDFDSESTGNQNLLDLVPYFISVCEGYTVIIDEIDTGIHDLLIDNIINNLKDYIKGQLIITTHNTLLIESDIPNDNIYVFNVDKNSNKELITITSFNGRIHKNINPRKKYLNGVYGGVPFVSYIDFDELIDSLE